MNTLSPNEEQLEFLAQHGLRDQHTGEIFLRNPRGVEGLVDVIASEKALLVGSNVVGVTCRSDVVDMLADSPQNFEGNIIDGPSTRLSSKLRLTGCTLVNYVLTGNGHIMGGIMQAGIMDIAQQRAALKPSLILSKEGLPDIVVNPNNRTVRVKDTVVHTTRTEFELFSILARNRGIVVTRDELFEIFSGKSNDDPHVVDVHLSNLRRKLDAVGVNNVYKTVRGIGFIITVE